VDVSSSPTTTTTTSISQNIKSKSSLSRNSSLQEDSSKDSPNRNKSGSIDENTEVDYLTPLVSNSSRQVIALTAEQTGTFTPERKPSGEEGVKKSLTPESSSGAEHYTSGSGFMQRSLFPSSITSEAWVGGGGGGSRPSSLTIDTSSFWTMNNGSENIEEEKKIIRIPKKSPSDSVKSTPVDTDSSYIEQSQYRLAANKPRPVRVEDSDIGLEHTDEWNFMGLPKSLPSFFAYRNENISGGLDESAGGNPTMKVATQLANTNDNSRSNAITTNVKEGALHQKTNTIRGNSSSSNKHHHHQPLHHQNRFTSSGSDTWASSSGATNVTSYAPPSSAAWSALSNTDRLPSKDKSKMNPTAVSSYGTSLFERSRMKQIAPNSYRGVSNKYTPGNDENDYNVENSSVVSSTFEISSSVSNLYNRKRIATTANGFPYLPSLHLSRNNLRESANSTNGNAGANFIGSRGANSSSGGISGGISTGLIGGLSDGKFQNSYLLRSQGRSSYIMSSNTNPTENEKNSSNSDKRGKYENSPRIPKYPPNFLASFDKRKKSKRILQWRNQQLKQTQQLSLNSDGQASTRNTQQSKYSPLSPTMQQTIIQSEDDDSASSCSYESQETDILSALSPPSQRFVQSSPKGRQSQERPNLAGITIEEKHPSEISCTNISTRDDNSRRFFPVTSPRRDHTKATTNRAPRTPKSTDNSNISRFPISPLTSAAAAVAESAMIGCSSPLLTNQNQKVSKESSTLSSRPQNEIDTNDNEYISAALHTNKQLLDDVVMSSSGEASDANTLELLCTPTRSNYNQTSCFNEVITSIGSNSSITPPITPRPEHQDEMNPFIPNSLSYWSPSVRSPSSASSNHAAEYDSSHCSLNPHDSRLRSRLTKPKVRSSCTFLHPLIEVWENCLYVRAEGARTGKLCLTNTHLIFFYEDDVSDTVLSENGLERNEVEHALREAFSRGAASIDDPLDNTSEGGGFEVVETDLMTDNHHEKNNQKGEKDLMELLECGLEDVTSPEEQEKENLTDNSTPSIDNRSVSDTIDTSSLANEDIDQSLLSKGKIGESNPTGEEVLQMKLNCQRRIENISPVPMSDSSSSSHSSDKPQQVDANNGIAPCSSERVNKDPTEESYEEVMNKCIIRAIKEEARRRLQELDEEDDSAAIISTVASCSAWSKDQLATIDQKERSRILIDSSSTDINLKSFDPECGVQTVMSSFSEMDLDVDPDEERRRYISGEGDRRRNTIGKKWPLSKLTEAFCRRYMMREVALELFAVSPSPSTYTTRQISSSNSVSTADGTTIEEVDVPLSPLSKSSVFLVIPDNDEANGHSNDKKILSRFSRKKRPRSRRRDEFIHTLKETIPHLNTAHWQTSNQISPYNSLNIQQSDTEMNQNFSSHKTWSATSFFKRKGSKSDPLNLLTKAWRKGNISNFDYLLRLNSIAGRSFHDPGNYPIMPWVLSNYVSTTVPDLSDAQNYRDLSKPMGALNEERLQKFMEKYAGLCSEMESSIPPFMYGSHYSNTGGVILHYFVRLTPFAGLHRQLQGGQFDLPDRLFKSIAQTWDHCSRTSTSEVKELTPEWYSDPAFLKNQFDFNLGTSYDGSSVGDVELPPWANNDPEKFIEVMRNALESDICSSMLPFWIDLIFGMKQRGIEAEKAHNIFYHLTYYEPEDIAKVEEESIRTEIQLHIAEFGHCPTQLFFKPHPHKKPDSIVSHSKGELRDLGGTLSMAVSNKEATTLTNPSPRRILRVQHPS